MFVFDDKDPALVPITVKGANGEFTLSLLPPSLEERVSDDGLAIERYQAKGADRTRAFTDRFMRRLGRVVDWSGITKPDGTAVPFSQASLIRMLSLNPDVVDQVDDAVAALYVVKRVQPGESQSGPITTDGGSTDSGNPLVVL